MTTGGWFVQTNSRPSVVQPAETWLQAFHGTWRYSVLSVLETGVLSEPKMTTLMGHDFHEPGFYWSPRLTTAKSYARAHRSLLVTGRITEFCTSFALTPPATQGAPACRHAVGTSVFGVVLHAIWIKANSPSKGEERIREWGPLVEADPRNSTARAGPICPTVNSRIDA